MGMDLQKRIDQVAPSQIIILAEKYWDVLYQEWRHAVETHWPGWMECFRNAPTEGEIDAVFRRAYESGAKRPPAWEAVKRDVFAIRKENASARVAESSADCNACHGAGWVMVLTYNPPAGRRRLIDPSNPPPAMPEYIYRVAVPCECAAGGAGDDPPSIQARRLAVRYRVDSDRTEARVREVCACLHAGTPIPPWSDEGIGDETPCPKGIGAFRQYADALTRRMTA